MLTKLIISIFTVSPMDGHKWQIARSEPAGERRNKLCSSILNNQEHPQPSLYNVQISHWSVVSNHLVQNMGLQH